MNDVSSDSLGGFEYTVCRDRFLYVPFGDRTLHKDVPCSYGAFLTVFSTTQLRALNNALGFLIITEVTMLGVVFQKMER